MNEKLKHDLSFSNDSNGWYCKQILETSEYGERLRKEKTLKAIRPFSSIQDRACELKT